MNRPFDEAKYKALSKGLEISEVNRSSIDLGDRIDPEFFSRSNIQLINKLKSIKSFELRLYGDFVASAFYPAATELYAQGEIPFIRCVDCINYPLITRAQEETFEKLPEWFVNNNSGICILRTYP